MPYCDYKAFYMVSKEDVKTSIENAETFVKSIDEFLAKNS